MENYFDLIVLGAGSGGLAAAKRAASYGARVAIVEGDRVGGTCVIKGCVPKKLLVYGSMYRDHIEMASSFGVQLKDSRIDAGILFSNVRTEVDRLNRLHMDFLKKAGVELVQGWGHFIDSNSIGVSDSECNRKVRILKGDRILIAVGGRPVRPDFPGVELAWVSDDIFLQKDLPERVIIVGAGFIACEFACILNSLGLEVIQIVRGQHLLKGFDRELTSVLKEDMRSKGIRICFGEFPVGIKEEINGLKLLIDSGEELSCGGVLLATGRRPFLKNLCLESAGVNVEGNKILVDMRLATNIPNIYAIGDVTDRIQLTPVAIEEGRIFADNIYGNKSRRVSYDNVPSAVFSQPEISGVGFTEESAIDNYGSEKIKVYRSSFRPMSRSLSKTGANCLLKLIVDVNTSKVIGCHMIGEHAAEIIQMASIAINMGATKSDFDRTMALHPTVAEEFVTMR